MKLKTNEIYEWIYKRIDSLTSELNIKTVMQGDFTSLPAPEAIKEWCNILLIKPTRNQIQNSSTDGSYQVIYLFELYFLRGINQDEPINATLVNATETLAEALFFSEDEDMDDRLADGSPVLSAHPTNIDYDSDVEGLLRALQLDITASKIDFQLQAEQF